jgi:hypothetical protein
MTPFALREDERFGSFWPSTRPTRDTPEACARQNRESTATIP